MNLPTEGWKLESTTDLKEATGTCELCGARLRFVHTVKNKDAGMSLDIGCECASRVIAGIELDYIKQKDKEIRREAVKEKKEAELYAAYLERCMRSGVEPETWETLKKRNEEIRARKEAQKEKNKRRK